MTLESPGRRAALLGQLLLFGFVMLWVGRAFLQHWDQVPPLTSVDPGWLAAAWLVGLAAQPLIPTVLWMLLRAHHVSTTWSRAFGLYFVPSQGKYVPGKVWALVWALAAYRKEGADTTVALTCLTLLSLSNFGSALLVGLLWAGQGAAQPALVWAMVALWLLSSHPAVFYGSLNGLRRLLRREPLPARLSLRALATIQGLSCLYWVILGLGLDCLIRALLTQSAPLSTVLSTQALAQASGLLAVFAPAGLGVREGVLASLLLPALGVGGALLVAASQRLWLLAVELPCALLGWFLLRRR